MRITNDQYFTNSALLAPLLREVDLIGDKEQPNLVLESCCGEGSLSEALLSAGCRTTSCDIDRNLSYPDFCRDARQLYSFPERYKEWEHPDWVVTNPPYTQPDCQQIIETAFDRAKIGIAFLLRVTYIEPCNNRAEFLESKWLSHLLVFNPRPRFRTDKKGSDSATVAWFVWQKHKKTELTKIVHCTNWNKTANQG